MRYWLNLEETSFSLKSGKEGKKPIYYRLTTIAKAHTLPGKHFLKMSENTKKMRYWLNLKETSFSLKSGKEGKKPIYYWLTTIAKAHTLPGKHFPKMSENKKK
jgi:hypothetical protein